MPSDNLSGSAPPPGTGSANKVSDAAAKIKSKASELNRSAEARIDSSRTAAAGGIASVAASVHGHADALPGGERVASMAHGAADKMSAAADYIRGHDMDAMVTDLKTWTKDNPGPALLVVGVVGFLLGKTFSSRD